MIERVMRTPATIGGVYAAVEAERARCANPIIQLTPSVPNSRSTVRYRSLLFVIMASFSPYRPKTVRSIDPTERPYLRTSFASRVELIVMALQALLIGLSLGLLVLCPGYIDDTSSPY